MMRLHLGGYLAYYEVEQRSSLDFSLAAPTKLKEIIHQLGIPADEIFLTVVNKEAVDLDSALVKTGDRVEVYPPMGGG